MKKSIKEISRKLKECRKALNEKNFKDLSFKDLIAPFVNLLNQIHAAKENNELDLPPLEDDKIDINKVLSTSEKDLSGDGSFTESYYKRTNNLLLKEDRTRKEILKDYIKQGGQKNLKDWRGYLDSGKISDEDKRRVASIGPNFYMIYDSAKAELEADGTPIDTPEETSNTSIPTPDPNYVPSENLQNLVDITSASADIQESAVTTVADKYDTIELLLRRVIRGKSTKRYYLLAGDPGIGKTYEVEKLLKEEGLEGKVPTCTGSIGRSTTSIAIFLWTHKDDDLVILDDCDSFLRKGGNIDVVNILKGCMEPGTHYKVGIPQNIANIATKQLKRANESKVSDKVKALFEDETEEELEDEERYEDDTLDTEDAIPTSWTFNAKLIILSNLHESQIEEALWSRCDHYDLHLTQEEYLIRLGMILDDMDVGQKEGVCTEEEAKEAKALTYSVMSAVIEAGNHGVQLYGKYVRLTNHLEFRIVKDLCNMWLALLDRELELNPKEDREEAKKKIMNKWVRIGVIPRLSATTKL